MNSSVYVKKVETIERTVGEILNSLDWKEVIKKNDSVLIKPNLCTKRLKTSATTNVDVLKWVIETLKDRTDDITIVETNSTGRKLDKVYESLSSTLDCELLDLTNEEMRKIEGTSETFLLPECIFNSKLVNVPVLKTHDQTLMTGCVKNLFGLLPRLDKYSHHYKIHEVLLDIFSNVKPDINILDATYCMEGLGPYMGDMKKLDVIAGSRDALAADIVGCKLMKLDPMKVKYLKMAMQKFNVKEDDVKILGDDIERISDKFELPNIFEFMLARSRNHPIYEKSIFIPFKSIIFRINQVYKKLV